jgi:hypothetical protein
MSDPITIKCKRIRVQGDAAALFQLVDLFTGERPVVPRNADFQIEGGLFFAEKIVDKSNLASVTVEFRTPGANETPPDPTQEPLLTITVAAGALAQPTCETWEDGTAQHAILAFTAAQNSVAAGEYWLDLYALTTDGTAKPILFARGIVCFEESGTNFGAPPNTPIGSGVPNTGIYLSAITGYTGGGATNADGLNLAPYAVGTKIEFYIGGKFSAWCVQMSTAATQVADDGGIIRGADSPAAPANGKCLISG